MAQVLLIIIIAIIGYLAVMIYRHDNTAFYKLTGYSYFDLWTDKKVRLTHNLVNALDTVQGPYKILVNLQVPMNNELQMIDAVLLHESGIYVIHIKEMKGWINGREQDFQWTEFLHKNQSRLFENPIHETKRLSYALQDQLSELDELLFNSVVLFTNDCSFQQIEVRSTNVEVTKTSRLKEWVSSLEGKHLTETEIQTIYAALEGKMNVKSSTVKLKNTVASTN